MATTQGCTAVGAGSIFPREGQVAGEFVQVAGVARPTGLGIGPAASADECAKRLWHDAVRGQSWPVGGGPWITSLAWLAAGGGRGDHGAPTRHP